MVGSENENAFDLVDPGRSYVSILQFHGTEAHSKRMTGMLLAEALIARAMIPLAKPIGYAAIEDFAYVEYLRMR
jgi:hypothetical protein